MAYRQRMSDLLEQVRNPKQEVQEAGPSDYLKSKMTDTQINNIKKTWAMKTAKDVTPAIKKMIKDLDIPTQLAIKHANINQISKLVEDHEISMAQGELKAISAKANDLANMLSGKSDETDELEAWVQSKITKAKDYIASVSDYLTHNPGHQNEELVKENFSTSQIARLKKEYEVLRGKKISVANANKLSQMFKNIPDSGLKDIFKADIPFLSVMAMTKMIQKGIPRPAGVKLNLEEVEILDEALHEIVDITEGSIDAKKFDSLKKGDTMTISYKSAMGNNVTGKKFKVKSKSRSAKYNTDKVTLHPDGNPSMARFFLYKRADGSVSMATGDMAVSMTNFKEEIDEGRMSEIDAMVKDGKTAAEIAKELKLNVRDVKAILGEEVKEEDEAEEPKEESEKVKLQKELLKKDDEIAALKQKAETEKAKTMKKETEKLVNPETGEPLLQVGIAYKHLKDKMSKESVDEGGAGSGRQPGSSKEVDKVNKSLAKARADRGKKDDADVSAINQALAKARADREIARRKEELEEMAKDKAYAIGMAAAKKKYNDEPPLEKKTIKKGHEIADKLLGMKKPVVDEGFASDAQRKAAFANGYKEKGKDKKEETIKEFKKMVVTIADPMKRKKAMDDVSKALNVPGGKGFTLTKMGDKFKVDGKGADLNKFATDLKNFYGATVVAEETIVEFTSQQIKMAYGIANDKRYKGGNYSGAVKAIEKIARGLSNHPDVQKVLKLTNENVNEAKGQDIANKMMKSKTMKSFAPKVAKMTSVTKGDLENMLPDYVAGADISKLFESPMMSMNKQSPEYKQGQQAAKQGKKYMNNPHSDAQKKLNWSGGHNNYRANNMAREMFESLTALKKKADKSGMPYSILKKVFDRGMAAWKGGHRPGASQHQWAYARVNSFVTKSSGTWGGADKDLAAKVKGE